MKQIQFKFTLKIPDLQQEIDIIKVHPINGYTVLPRFTRLPWLIKNCVNQKPRYTSHSMDKVIVKKMSKKFL